MPYKVLIRKNSTGEVRTVEISGSWFDADSAMGSLIYWWKTGNYSCDCNRASEFDRASGEGDLEDYPCGNDRFSALYAELEDGTKIPIDEPIKPEIGRPAPKSDPAPDYVWDTLETPERVRTCPNCKGLEIAEKHAGNYQPDGTNPNPARCASCGWQGAVSDTIRKESGKSP